MVPHKGKRGETGGGGDEDVDIGDEMPMGSYPPVEIDRDDVRSNTSSSSSSSSDSSSSSGMRFDYFLGFPGSAELYIHWVEMGMGVELMWMQL